MIPTLEEYNKAKEITIVYENEQKRLYNLKVEAFKVDLQEYFDNNLIDGIFRLKEILVMVKLYQLILVWKKITKVVIMKILKKFVKNTELILVLFIGAIISNVVRWQVLQFATNVTFCGLAKYRLAECSNLVQRLVAVFCQTTVISRFYSCLA